MLKRWHLSKKGAQKKRNEKLEREGSKMSETVESWKFKCLIDLYCPLLVSTEWRICYLHSNPTATVIAWWAHFLPSSITRSVHRTVHIRSSGVFDSPSVEVHAFYELFNVPNMFTYSEKDEIVSLCIIYGKLYLWHEPIYYIGTYMRTSISILKTSCSVCTCCGSLRDLSGCRSKINPINMWRSSTVKCGACTTSHALLLWRPPSQPAGI